ncbi:tellurite resistance TerB family protein [SAR92 clade bacterium H246]
MIDRIKSFFAKNVLEPEETVTSEQIAVAALLIEVMVIDGNLDAHELESISQTLCNILELEAEMVEELLRLSREEVAEATSVYQFTREINEHFELDKKMNLLTAMWRVAYADGYLDKHEEGIIRRVADLLHIRHNEYIRCKLAARGE